MPDDDGYHQTATTFNLSGVAPCATPPPDAGDASAETNPSFGCRLVRESETTVEPTCSKAFVGGGDGASCEDGAGCAPGFDCIVGEKDIKTCRRYCCSGSCKDQLSQSGGATFCDVQSLVGSPVNGNLVNQKVPVCMPLKRCKLLGTGECTADETCAVVTESGDTGCVVVGEQQVGTSCDEDHCAANLTCLGKPGTRKCFKLCKVSSSDCGASQVCDTSTVFKDPNFGICQKP